jgi:hypothetical protein
VLAAQPAVLTPELASTPAALRPPTQLNLRDGKLLGAAMSKTLYNMLGTQPATKHPELGYIKYKKKQSTPSCTLTQNTKHATMWRNRAEHACSLRSSAAAG